jgi:hypothetical protein
VSPWVYQGPTQEECQSLTHAPTGNANPYIIVEILGENA